MVHIYQRGEIKAETNVTTRKCSHYKGSSIYNSSLKDTSLASSPFILMLIYKRYLIVWRVLAASHAILSVPLFSQSHHILQEIVLGLGSVQPRPASNDPHRSAP
jgi:hypothetical protein